MFISGIAHPPPHCQGSSGGLDRQHEVSLKTCFVIPDLTAREQREIRKHVQTWTWPVQHIFLHFHNLFFFMVGGGMGSTFFLLLISLSISTIYVALCKWGNTDHELNYLGKKIEPIAPSHFGCRSCVLTIYTYVNVWDMLLILLKEIFEVLKNKNAQSGNIWLLETRWRVYAIYYI